MKSAFPTVTIMLDLAFSTSAISAVEPTLIDRQLARMEEKIGVVSVSGVNGSSDDAVRKLQEKGAAIGGSKLRIISLGTRGDPSFWMGSAEVYR